MANLVYPNGYINGVLQPYILWGSNYLRANAKSPIPDDEIDSYPPDFNDDQKVDQLDLDRLLIYIGSGNGVALSEISPNFGSIYSFHNNTLPWRRYDLNGDGWVDNKDLEIVNQLVAQQIPMVQDIVFPTASLKSHKSGDVVVKGSYVHLKSYAWDNKGLSNIKFYVNDRLICDNKLEIWYGGFESTFFNCWWQVPKKGKNSQHTIKIQAQDVSGNLSESSVVLIAQ